MDGPIQESSPASEMIDSLFSRTNSRTGIVVPVMRLCIRCLLGRGTGILLRKRRVYNGADLGPQTFGFRLSAFGVGLQHEGRRASISFGEFEGEIQALVMTWRRLSFLG